MKTGSCEAARNITSKNFGHTIWKLKLLQSATHVASYYHWGQLIRMSECFWRTMSLRWNYCCCTLSNTAL